MSLSSGTGNAKHVFARIASGVSRAAFARIRTDVPKSDATQCQCLRAERPANGLQSAVVDKRQRSNHRNRRCFRYPNAESDLRCYRSHYGQSACTTANGCFKKVDEHGGTNYPPSNSRLGWRDALDLDMASAICPNCHIVLVEADNNNFVNARNAEDQAVKQGAGQVSNSYGGSEFAGTNKHYSHKGVVITASSGDGGYGAQQPCSWASVVCVGGTTLTKVSPRTEGRLDRRRQRMQCHGEKANMANG